MNLREIFWAPKQKKNYKIIKYISIIVGALTIPLDVYIGFLLGTEKYSLAFPLIGVTIIVSVTDSLVWAWVLEQMAKDKVKFGRKR